uniref:uncharacterized protein LOC124054447 isoform X2 n=1 Tax=Scatophagus argus TaxID=75038 RepID=UPI001ED82FFF|nr:uncharacterized protein LOC124054447 isoform X2 [Scatophagus argus]
MTALLSVDFYLKCLFLWKMTTTALSSSVHQDKDLVLVKTGDNFTLQCSYKSGVPAKYYWFKQILGQKPRLISSFSILDKNGTFHDEFKNNPRFTLDTKNGRNDLTMTDLHISDSATYNCISCFLYTINISESITVSVKDSNLNTPVLVHQSASETIQPGGSVTLNCTVHTGTCDGEHSVYWFKNSGESPPGLIYTHGGRKDQCERNPNTQTPSCVYKLALKSLNLSHAGIYYCAVAICGHILFGNGTKLDFGPVEDSLVLMYFLSGALAFTTVFLVLLAFLVCRMNKSFQSPEARCSAPSMSNAEGYRDADDLHYAALNVNLPNRSRRQRDNTKSECVYSSVKQ